MERKIQEYRDLLEKDKDLIWSYVESRGEDAELRKKVLYSLVDPGDILETKDGMPIHLKVSLESLSDSVLSVLKTYGSHRKSSIEERTIGHYLGGDSGDIPYRAPERLVDRMDWIDYFARKMQKKDLVGYRPMFFGGQTDVTLADTPKFVKFARPLIEKLDQAELRRSEGDIDGAIELREEVEKGMSKRWIFWMERFRVEKEKILIDKTMSKEEVRMRFHDQPVKFETHSIEGFGFLDLYERLLPYVWT
ncbi:hypothetical protein HN840_02550 [archaeon]|nr:hypothetical protein [archaeon]MBT5287872.1 hypothetical protein [archaeon]MBT7281190.1 hypothetical protein [archaeon]